MAAITLRGNPIHTNGDLPEAGKPAPDFKLTSATLEDVSLSTFGGKKKVLSISASLDTGVCAASAKAFNDKISGMSDVVVLVITCDLPFAQKRFCGMEDLNNITALSLMRDRNFAKDYGLLVTDGPMRGLLARAVVVLDADNRELHTQLVPEISQEPDYDAALKALS